MPADGTRAASACRGATGAGGRGGRPRCRRPRRWGLGRGSSPTGWADMPAPAQHSHLEWVERAVGAAALDTGEQVQRAAEALLATRGG